MSGYTDKKYLFIKYGPPASGKSKIDDYVMQHYGIAKEQLYINDIDSIVENNQEYKDKLAKLKCIEYLNKYNDYKDINEVDQNIRNCTNLYFEIRNKMNAAEIADIETKKAVEEKKHIIYELTGCNAGPDKSKWWLVPDLKSKREDGYTIIIYYPLVISKELAKRSLERAKKTGRFVAVDLIHSCAIEAITNIGYLITQKVNDKSLIDEVYIYNNVEYSDLNIDDMQIYTNIDNKERCNISKLGTIQGEYDLLKALSTAFKYCGNKIKALELLPDEQANSEWNPLVQPPSQPAQPPRPLPQPQSAQPVQLQQPPQPQQSSKPSNKGAIVNNIAEIALNTSRVAEAAASSGCTIL